MLKKKIGLFFGAGAEISYGLPSGGEFALDIFRMSKQEDKDEFGEMIKKIDDQSQIVTSGWLPKNFRDRSLFVFGKGNFEDIISSSLENRRDSILSYFNNFDKNVTDLLVNWDINKNEIQESFKRKTKLNFGEKLYSEEIEFNDKITQNSSLFGSEYFSAILKLIEMFPRETSEMSKVVISFLEFLVGSMGEDLVSDLNQRLFKKKPKKIGIFNDLSNPFSLNYSAAGQSGLEIVLEKNNNDSVKNGDDAIKIFNKLSKDILSQLYAENLDYQSLIDSHFRYLYRPSSDWAKFTRIAIFLYSVRRYIKSRLDYKSTKIIYRHGYYRDLKILKNFYDIQAIGTTNYNNLISKVLDNVQVKPVGGIYHLNGNVSDFYDPYKNKIAKQPDGSKYNDILVPLIFTQSGTKPLTSISMLKRYVNLYDNFLKCDEIAVIGFGFNGDDGHVNGLFRSLLEDENKIVHIFHYCNDNPGMSEEQCKKKYQEKLRINSSENLRIHLINSARQVNGKPWYKSLITE